MNTIFVTELRIETLIGIYEWERRVPQTIQLDLEIGLPGNPGKRIEHIGDTIDYSKVVARVEQLFKAQHFTLLENAGETIAQIILTEFKAPWVRLSIAKLSPLRNVKRLGVTIERGERPA